MQFKKPDTRSSVMIWMGLVCVAMLLWLWPQSGDQFGDRSDGQFSAGTDDRSGETSGLPTYQPYTPVPHACRFWASTAEQIPGEVIDQHLLTLPYSILNLSDANPDGWALGYWTGTGGEPVVQRGAPPAFLDPMFRAAAEQMRTMEPRIGMGHIRNCSSGLCDIPNPHLFRRQMDDRTWLLAHNGSIDKELLLELIDPGFLATNPPEVGENQEEWIDSELFFLYLLQCFEGKNWSVRHGLGQAVSWLRSLIPGDQEYLNFILSEGDTLWAYKEGPSAFRQHTEYNGIWYTAIASRYPDKPMDPWISMLNGELVSVTPGAPPVVEDIDIYLDMTVAPELPSGATGARLLPNFPNPFNPRTRIRFELSEPGWLDISVFDAGGARVARLADGPCDGGRFEIDWLARTSSGRELPSGIYLLRLSSGNFTATRKMVLAR
jgi:predicted glutamine amidotransferase